MAAYMALVTDTWELVADLLSEQVEQVRNRGENQGQMGVVSG